MSETDWHKIQRKLEGRCHFCAGELPEHKGVCPVYGEELQRKYDDINRGIDKIEDAVKNIIPELYYGK
tara:strand:+ start:5372 stop:5575 length:204 start_codon:yes stop_codon:yes gene_type:complete